MSTAAGKPCQAPPVYRRRRPERTLLYRLVQAHLATWLALCDEGGNFRLTIGSKSGNTRGMVVEFPILHFSDVQKRLIAATVDGVRIVCAYVPNGQSLDSDKYAYKLAWLDALAPWIAEQLAASPQLALAGDFNIAPEDRDVHNPAAWAGQILCSEPERAAFKRLLDLGLKDSFRLFAQPEKSFSWWDYRMLGFQKNQGLRIDHILLSAPLAARCTAAAIDREMRKRERPSDHAPVTAELGA